MMNRITICGTVFGEPTHGINKGREYLKLKVNTGTEMMHVPEIIPKRGKLTEFCNLHVRLYDDAAAEWWGAITEGDNVYIEGFIATTYGCRFSYVIPNTMRLAEPDEPKQNHAEIEAWVARDDKHVYCWDKDGVMFDEMIPKPVAIEHPFLVNAGNKAMIKVKAYDDNALKALEKSVVRNKVMLRGPMQTWNYWSAGMKYDYAVLAEQIWFEGEEGYES